MATLRRRSFLRLAIASGTLAWTGGRPAEALLEPHSRASGWPLAAPVVVPLEEVSQPWHPVPFDAWFDLPSESDTAPHERRLKGFLLRIPPSEHGAGGVEALCRLCPHELCWVDLHEPSSVPPVLEERPDHPLLVCPCHTSIFDPARGGALVSGPALRGLYRFSLEEGPTQVTITEIERSAIEA